MTNNQQDREAVAGGQDRKFAFIDGQYVNRVSGEPILHDEPIIIFRARDHHSLSVLREYLGMVDDPHHRQAVQERIAEFTAFARAHPERMKEPGITHHIRLTSDTERASPGAAEAWDIDAVRAVEAEFRRLRPAKRHEAIKTALAARGAPIPETLALMIQRVDDQYDLAGQNNWRAERAEKALRTLGYDAPTADDLLVRLPAPEQPAQASEVERLRSAVRALRATLQSIANDEGDTTIGRRCLAAIGKSRVPASGSAHGLPALATHPSTGDEA